MKKSRFIIKYKYLRPKSSYKQLKESRSSIYNQLACNVLSRYALFNFKRINTGKTVFQAKRINFKELIPAEHYNKDATDDLV